MDGPSVGHLRVRNRENDPSIQQGPGSLPRATRAESGRQGRRTRRSSPLPVLHALAGVIYVVPHALGPILSTVQRV